MPWCEDCAKFWTPSSMPVDGSCPTCGRTLATPARESEKEVVEDRPTAPGKLDLKKLAGEDAKAPWHFKVLMVALAIYLGWRLVQLVMLIA
jgi:hypothetical protein